MIIQAHRLRIGAVLALSILAAACSNAPHPRSVASPPVSTDRGEIEAIATLLDQGETRKAKKRLAAALKREPGNASLMLLRDSMELDPITLLGPNSFSYSVQQGDSIASLAQRFLGNRLKSHQLARYNGIPGPAVLAPGQVLRIPGQDPRAEPVRRPERRADPQPAVVRPKPSSPARPAATAPAAAANAAAARQARSAGLAALNEGNPARAVGLLSRAASLDPGNAAIARDLARARRIQATVKARQ
ncbi:LysM peptidoglycan-binding domain-containing protein [Novosphingobium sp. JCM 18896]|uniref:LysM peptidoglycan-binding domain-containing protein n=1 Tax=Novosphingobium sp. JCM 18896 TaxID=2989731 RepID=UPI0022213EEB|nr:LysM peptidoglycan-binding domain-containing protein [Novosphingobium sp. JCM 18896]MCW1430196.1 LysM peptidoglycan-binding domain-containing protein [Novosphingobium sp. JCM 18896]